MILQKNKNMCKIRFHVYLIEIIKNKIKLFHVSYAVKQLVNKS